MVCVDHKGPGDAQLVRPGSRRAADRPDAGRTGAAAGSLTPRAPQARRLEWLAVLLLTSVVLLAHGWSLNDGLFFDDHLHHHQYPDADGSLRGLLDATTVAPDQFIQSWWQTEPIAWHYTRPFAVLLVRVVLLATGGSVAALHGLSILLHLASVLMIYVLCMRLTRRPFWAFAGAMLFAVYAHTVYAVGWLAAQNAVLQTTLMLAALLCYVRASRLELCPAGPPRTLTGAAPGEARTPEQGAPASSTGTSGYDRRFLVLAVGLWLLAMMSREGAVVFPVIAASFDLAFGGRRHLRRRWPVFALLGTIAIGFIVWRMTVVYHPVPDFYLRRYDGPGYVGWWLIKLLHYVTAVVWQSPLMFGPTLRLDPLREVPGDCLLMLAIVGIMGTGYVLACRGVAGWWIWPLWILLSVLPVVPMMASPHSGYMPGVGFAVAMVLGAGLRDRTRPSGVGRWSPAVAIAFLVATCSYVPIYRAMWNSVMAAERITMEQVRIDPPPPATTDVFFINLPFVNVYANLYLDPVPEGETEPVVDGGVAGHRRLFPQGVRSHVLTWSNNVLRMDQRCRLEQHDGHRFSIRLLEGRPYFSGPMGRFLVEAMRGGDRLTAGQVVPGELFDVHVLEADEQGVRELTFTFHEPLSSPQYCFYLATEAREAVRVRFAAPDAFSAADPDLGLSSDGRIDPGEVAAMGHRLLTGAADAGTALLAVMDGGDQPARAAAWDAFRTVALPVAEALAAPQADLLSGEAPGPEDVARLAGWWSCHVGDGLLEAVWLGRYDFASLRRRRDALFRIRAVAEKIILTDLYMTGPPFPGPR